MSIRLRDWRARLSELTEWDVRGAADLAAAQRDVGRDTCYVTYLSEDDDDRGQVAVDNLRRYGVAVLLAVRNRRGPGGDALDEIEDLRTPTVRALAGWRPPGAAGPVAFRRGRLLPCPRSAAPRRWAPCPRLRHIRRCRRAPRGSTSASRSRRSVPACPGARAAA